MKLEVLLSVMNYKLKDLNKHNITSDCTVINQCNKNGYKKYQNFKIYSYNERGAANSRNRGLEHVTNDIILLSDDDMVYEDNYKETVLNAFKSNPKADMIIFNVYSPNRPKRMIKKNRRLHIYNSLHYATCNIAFKRNSVGNIRFNNLFGPNGYYKNAGGDDTLFIVSFLNNKLKVYSNTQYIGTVYHEKSTWHKEHDKDFFFDKGALYTAINKHFRLLLILQFLIRHKELLDMMSFGKAFKYMMAGSNDYLKTIKQMEGVNNE